MELKKRLFLNYLALFVGFTALVIATIVTPKKAKIFVQRQSYPQGPANLDVKIIQKTSSSIKLSFFLKAVRGNVTGLMMTNFVLSAKDRTNNQLNLKEFRLGDDFAGICDLDENPEACRGRMFSKEGDKYVFRGVLMGKRISQGQELPLVTATFQLNNKGYVFSVGHTYSQGSGDTYQLFDYYDLTQGGNSTDYDMLSGLSGNLVIQNQVMVPTPTLTPVPTLTPTPTPTPSTISIGTILNLVKTQQTVINPNQQSLKVALMLKTDNPHVDSLDILFKYSSGLSFASPAFSKGSGVGSGATVSKRGIDVHNHLFRLSITGVRLTKPAGQNSYFIGTFNLLLNAKNTQNVHLVYTPGSTVDTNVNYQGQDILRAVGPGLSISPKVVLPTPTPIPTLTPIPPLTLTPTPTSAPTPSPISQSNIKFSIQASLPVIHKIENSQATMADHERLPALVFLIKQDGGLTPLWWLSTVNNVSYEPTLWFTYLADKQAVIGSDDQNVIAVSLDNIKNSKGIIIKMAGFLAKKIIWSNNQPNCQNNSQLEICHIDLGRIIPGDINAAGKRPSDMYNQALVAKYKTLLDWSKYVKGQSPYLEASLRWFSDDYINSFDTGFYPLTLANNNFYINWFGGKKANRYKRMPFEGSATVMSQKYYPTMIFNLLDLDGNRYLNALDWSLVHNSINSSQSGHGDLYSFIQGIK